MDATAFLKHALDPGRLAVLGAVAARGWSASGLADFSGMSERAVLEALAPLVRAGIVEFSSGQYRLRPEALRDLARALPQPEPPARAVFLGMTEDEAAVLSRFFQGERLTEIPPSRGKRLVILERIALDFEPGVRYPEADVNKVLQSYHDDYASLRRYLVDEGFLDREHSVYWRSGGRVD